MSKLLFSLSQELFGNLCKCYPGQDCFCQTKLRTKYTEISFAINQTISWVLCNKNGWIRYQVPWCWYQFGLNSQYWEDEMASRRRIWIYSATIMPFFTFAWKAQIVHWSQYSGSVAPLWQWGEKPEKVPGFPNNLNKVLYRASCHCIEDKKPRN